MYCFKYYFTIVLCVNYYACYREYDGGYGNGGYGSGNGHGGYGSHRSHPHYGRHGYGNRREFNGFDDQRDRGISMYSGQSGQNSLNPRAIANSIEKAEIALSNAGKAIIANARSDDGLNSAINKAQELHEKFIQFLKEKLSFFYNSLGSDGKRKFDESLELIKNRFQIGFQKANEWIQQIKNKIHQLGKEGGISSYNNLDYRDHNRHRGGYGNEYETPLGSHGGYRGQRGQRGHRGYPGQRRQSGYEGHESHRDSDGGIRSFSSMDESDDEDSSDDGDKGGGKGGGRGTGGWKYNEKDQLRGANSVMLGFGI
ncbi:uncharacterized protein LOC128958336 isoform X2 [Oppia nitens]|uniref:uncharacterized protein LOC128958336 isoform X2 n=1 Tax=Oppia nitens TaxID=1686743 RepID=UPI0023DB0F00|nr:uncharacterized protein LOC128958336 isoform X2 [Oppia nitens]